MTTLQRLQKENKKLKLIIQNIDFELYGEIKLGYEPDRVTTIQVLKRRIEALCKNL